jgi:RNA polymerase sigma-70 factor (ECF subfamily)
MTGFLDARGPELLAYARRLVPADLARVVDPQDVVQDTCVEAFRRLREFEPRGPDADRRWLMTIARHLVVNLTVAHRAAKRGGGRRDALAGASAEDLVALLERLAVYERTPSASAVAHEAAARLHAAIDALPADQRLAVRLRHVEALPAAAVAAAMGRSEGAVHMLVARALAALRLALADGEGGG